MINEIDELIDFLEPYSFEDTIDVKLTGRYVSIILRALESYKEEIKIG